MHWLQVKCDDRCNRILSHACFSSLRVSPPGFIEPPSSIVFDDVRYGPSHAVCGILELLCLAIYTFHAVKQWRAYGPGSKGYWRSPWRTFKVPILIICIGDVIVSMARNVDAPAIHLSQVRGKKRRIQSQSNG
jgi:hypothetical protein